MSLFGLPSLRGLKSAIAKMRTRFAGGSHRRGRELRPRRLLIDPLEQRQLLSLAPADWDQVMVNQQIIDQQDMISGQSIAVDNDGDFVVVWTRYDEVLDTLGNPVVDPSTGLVMRDANIYARYFTDEVQRLVLPDAVLNDTNPAGLALVTLVANGTEEQRLSITATYEPYAAQGSQALIAGTLVLGFDTDRNGVISEPAETTSVIFNEAAPLTANALAIQTQLRGLGGDLSDVRVVGISPHEYSIQFGNASLGPGGIPEDQPPIMVLYHFTDLNPAVPGIQPPSLSTQFTSGFYPFAEVTTVRQPVVLANIPISPTDPSLTALAMEQAFLLTSTTFSMGPVELGPQGADGPTAIPDSMRVPVPQVSVSPVYHVPGHADGTVFDITFDGASGKKDHPLLFVSQVLDENGVPLVTGTSVTTLKEPSPEFRVNPEEPDNPFTILPDKFAQTHPAVAMDVDGDFVITWQSEVPNWVNAQSVSDIFARRFKPVGIQDPADIDFIVDMNRDGIREFAVQGVMGMVSPEATVVQTLTVDATAPGPLLGQFRLRVGDKLTRDITFDSTNLPLTTSAIAGALTAAGFKDVVVQSTSPTDPYRFTVRFKATFSGPNGTKDTILQYQAPTAGTPLGDLATISANLDPTVDLYTFRVNQFTTNAQGQPSVGMDDAGNFVIVWASGAQDVSFFNSVRARRYNRHGVPQGDEWLVNTEDTRVHTLPDVGVSNNGYFVIAWTIDGGSVVSEIYDPAGNVLRQQAGVAGGFNPNIAFDSGGKFLITYSVLADDDQGGSETSVGVRGIEYGLFDANGNFSFRTVRPEFRLNDASFNPGTEPTWPFTQTGSEPMLDADGDLVVVYEGFGPDVSEIEVDQVIENQLVTAAAAGATPEELGQLRAQLESALKWLRGEAYGALYSRFDADVDLGPQLILASDAIVNNFPDGHNSRYYIAFDPTVDQGNYTLLLSGLGGAEATQQIQYQRSDLAASRTNLENALQGLDHTSFGWPNPFGGPIDVRFVSGAEILQRAGTPWQLVGIPSSYIVFEITFQGSVHDSPAFLSLSEWSGNTQGVNEVQLLTFAGVTGPGYFALQVGAQTTNNIYFDPLDPNTAALAIQSQLRAIVTGLDQNGNPIMPYSGAVVVYRPGTSFEFEITFAGASGGTNHPQVTQGALQGPPFPTPALPGNIIGTTLQQGGSTAAPAPRMLHNQFGSSGTIQQHVSGGMEPDGDFTTVFVQHEEYTNGFFSNTNIFYRRFDENTDTAGPILTDLVDAYGNSVAPGEFVVGPVQHIVLTFDDDLFGGDPAVFRDSVLNPQNFRLYQGDVEIPFGVAKVEFGLSMASQLNGLPDGVDHDGDGVPDGVYRLNAIPTNKWEAVLTLDANGGFSPGVPALGIGTYTIEALAPRPADGVSGLRDKAGNPLGYSGYVPGGQNFGSVFVVTVDRPDVAVDIPVASGLVVNGTTHPETPSAIGMDADGDYVVTWTAFDSALGHDRVYYRLFDADGTPADLVYLGPDGTPLRNAQGQILVARDAAPALPVTPLSSHPQFQGNIQRFAAVAVDPDGDFVITWTQYSDGNADIYARQFDSVGGIAGIDFDTGNVVFKSNAPAAFQVNQFTTYAQKWSDVAIDIDGDFVITWSSYGQEMNGQLGYGYGIYARRYDWTGRALAPEFRVNTTIAGNQQSPAVAMGGEGNFVIVWVSDQNGIGDDIIAREFTAEGTPQQGYLGGEILVNDIVAGNQRWPDVSMRIDGDTYVVTWSDSAADLSGWSVWAELSRPLPNRYQDLLSHVITQTHRFTIDVTDNFVISDVNVHLGILSHQKLEELQVALISPAGTRVLLFDALPRPFADGTRPPGNMMIDTTFDDQAPSGIRIIDSDAGAVPTYTGSFIPQQLLAAFNGENSQGTWTLEVIDTVNNFLIGSLGPISTEIGSWSIDLTDANATSQSFAVTTTREGDQMFSSVAMDYQGGFTVAWSGRGTRQNEQDTSGVFYQRYNDVGGRVGLERRANQNIEGDQWIPSIATDASGNIGMVWTGVGASAGTSDVYHFASVVFDPRRDNEGPIVTDVLFGGKRVLQGDILGTNGEPVTSMTVVFSENISVSGGTTGETSILNPKNWAIEVNGSEIIGGITGVQFERNPVTRKYEATVTFDGNGILAGTPALPPGDYVLSVRDKITDVSIYFDPLAQPGQEVVMGNPLDGDANGVPRSEPLTIGYGAYRHQFAIAGTPQLGPEFRINDPVNISWEQRLAAAVGTGFGREDSTTGMAMDLDGDFVAVWTAYGLDDPTDPSGGGIYFRMFDRNNNVLPGSAAGDTRVNVTTAGNQRDAAVAMDADGDFVVVWEGPGDNPDGSRGIWARRYNSVGQPLGGEFLVNSNTQNEQFNPAVAMDDFGNFVVVWVSAGQNFSYFNDVRGQLYNYRGERVGSEFRVNVSNLPGVPNAEVNPAVAMDDEGNFVVVWEQVTAQQNGVATDTQLMARLFGPTGTPVTGEFRADTGVGTGGTDIGRTARNPQAVMDDQGGFIIVWESYMGTAQLGYDIFYQRYDSNANAIASGQVNMAQFEQSQVNPSVGIDADGDFAVVWNGFGAEPDPFDPNNTNLWANLDQEGVFLRKYNAANQPVGAQTRVNRTEVGIQHFPTIAVEPDGDMLVVWGGNGVGDRHGIFARRYDEPTDTAGPIVTDVTTLDGRRLEPGVELTEPLTHLVVVFSEDMMKLGPSNVENPANYALIRDGGEIPEGIVSINFGLNPATNKWEAVFTLDGNGAAPGVEPLRDGQYQIVVRNSLRDVVGNPLYATGALPNGRDFSTSFGIVVLAGQDVIVNQTTANDQVISFTTASEPGSPRSVASDGDGEYVVVWTDTNPTHRGIYARLYNDLRWFDTPNGRQSIGPNPSGEILVTSNPTARFASVARDADGDFVVVWEQDDNPDPNVEDWNIWARRFDATGVPFADPFRVNNETEKAQRYPSVAMDSDGDFVVTWQSLDQDGSGWGVYAQRYSPAGFPLGGVDEIQLITFVGNPRGTFALLWDGDNNPATPNTTGPINFTGNTFEVADQVESRLNALGVDVTGRQVNRVEVSALSFTQLEIRFTGPGGSTDQVQLALDPAGTNLVGDPGATVIISTQVEGQSGEFRVNETTANNQMYPSVAMSQSGDFVISWTSAGQAGDAGNETNIYARMFPSNDVYGPFRGDPLLYANNPRAEWMNQITRIVSTDPIANHAVTPGTGYDGVVQVISNFPVASGLGSGSLLWTGFHILTAAHVVYEPLFGGQANSVDITFNMPTPVGPTTITSTQIIVHPAYDPNTLANDLAIIVLPQQAPAGAERYRIYRGSDELGKQNEIVGYGATGQGMTGDVIPPAGKYRGLNVYEVLGERFNGMPWTDFRIPLPGSVQLPAGKVLAYDFDSGLPANDAFGVLFGLNNLGLGNNEASSAHGDSGGPNFINGLIAGVVSFGLEPAVTDVDANPTNVTFGSVSFDTRVSAYADWIDQVVATAPAGTAEFLVNQTVAGVQKWSSVAMDADGDFVVTWTSYGQDGVGTGYGAGVAGEEGVFARRFDSNASAVGNEFQVNTYAAGKQQRSQVAMDADGDFIIVWESFQDRDTPASAQADSFGVYAQRYVATWKIATNPLYGPNGELGSELPVSNTKPGGQRFPSVFMDHTGDSVIVWGGTGLQPSANQNDTQGIFHVRQNKLADDAGPIVTDVLNVVVSNGTPLLQQVLDDAVLENQVDRFVVAFSEDLYDLTATAMESITNPSNWVLLRNGSIVTGGVASVTFGLNQAFLNQGVGAVADPLVSRPTNKYEAVIVFDSDPLVAGRQPLGPGLYELQIRDSVEDLFENMLDGNYDGTPGGSFRRGFTIIGGEDVPDNPPGEPDPTQPEQPIHSDETGIQESPAVASNARGDYVVVWTDRRQATDPATGAPIVDPVTGQPVYYGDIVAQRFNSRGEPQGFQFTVNSYQFGNQYQPAVAMDDFGNFVIVWSGEGNAWDDPEVIETSGIYGRVFDAFGVPLGDQFQVNQYRQNVQDAPSVAMDADGDFVVAWTSYGQDSDKDGVFARRYSLQGIPKGNEFLVNTVVLNRQEDPDVAMDAAGNFTIVWSAYRHGADNSEWGVFGQRYDAAGNRLGGEFRVNSHTTDDQFDTHIAMADNGNFVVVWSSFNQDGSGYGVYGQRYNAAGAKVGSEFRVNQQTLHWQYQPDVAMDSTGKFVVTWTSIGQDNPDQQDAGVFARIFNADGSDFADPAGGGALGEFRVNVRRIGNQNNSAVAMDADGNMVVVWVGPDADQTGIYQRLMGIGASALPPPGPQLVGVNQIGNLYLSAGSGSAGGSQAMMLSGTPGNDVFEFTAAASPGSWLIRVNGTRYYANQYTTAVYFDGLGGNDKVVLKGTTGNEQLLAWPDHVVFQGANFTVSTTSTETLVADGRGGNDKAVLYDSAGNDKFVATADYADMSGSGFSMRVSGFAEVVAQSTAGGNDSAKLYDSAGNDTFVATADYAELSGAGFKNRAVSFRYVTAYASAGSDTARLFSNAQTNDTFEASPTYAVLRGGTFANWAKNFDQVYATSTGGKDSAKLYDSAGDDTFVGRPEFSSLAGTGYYLQASNFRYVTAYASAGNDKATLYDDPSAVDWFVAGADYAKLSGPNSYVYVRRFDSVAANSSGGNDGVYLYDSAGDDTFVVTPTYGLLSGSGFSNKATGFARVNAVSRLGGNDVAKLYDSAGDDQLISTQAYTSLAGSGFYSRAMGFPSVIAYASTGNDVAKLYDTPGNDTFTGRPTYATLVGTGYRREVRSFDVTYVYAKAGGYDQAYLYDSALETAPDLLRARDNWVHLSNEVLGYAYWLVDFDQVEAYSSNESDTADVPMAVDYVVTKGVW